MIKELETIVNSLEKEMISANNSIILSIYKALCDLNLEELGQTIANCMLEELNNKDKLILNAIKKILSR